MARKRKFAVFLHGVGVLLRLNGEEMNAGVRCWKGVEAENEMSALVEAIESLLNDPRFTSDVVNDISNPPDFSAEKITELEDSFELKEADSNLVFYIEEDD